MPREFEIHITDAPNPRNVSVREIVKGRGQPVKVKGSMTLNVVDSSVYEMAVTALKEIRVMVDEQFTTGKVEAFERADVALKKMGLK